MKHRLSSHRRVQLLVEVCFHLQVIYSPVLSLSSRLVLSPTLLLSSILV
jgi:hypothetical protein